MRGIRGMVVFLIVVALAAAVFTYFFARKADKEQAPATQVTTPAPAPATPAPAN